MPYFENVGTSRTIVHLADGTSVKFAPADTKGCILEVDDVTRVLVLQALTGGAAPMIVEVAAPEPVASQSDTRLLPPVTGQVTASDESDSEEKQASETGTEAGDIGNESATTGDSGGDSGRGRGWRRKRRRRP